MDIWGGIECTINRIGNEFKDQLNYSGHYHRQGDIEAIADLGIRMIRYPVLWEKHQPEKNTSINWRWTDRQLQTIRDSGMTPIAGLLHHGSGPYYTNLLDPEFPNLFAAYAYEVASRYPWINHYTPVNEPLTTARFSGLYGLWYPHIREEVSFYKMLLNQLKATVLAMEAIRTINPNAKLIQTEDLGKTYSTPLLGYQAFFENERRLLTFDILNGRLRDGHPQYEYMLECGVTEEEINFFQRQSVQPDILGLNYYVTSERWLDESLENYDVQTHGGNGIHRYADTEVVRANPGREVGFKVLVEEIWERYGIPIAITECHLHCTREEQLRWFKEIYDQALELSQHGANIKAITAWALLGSFDWDSLLTRTGTQYESGVFDITTLAGALRPTALAVLIKDINLQKGSLHPVISAPGWWQVDRDFLSDNKRPAIVMAEKADADTEALFASLADACLQRRLHFGICKDCDELNVLQFDPWAVIRLLPHSKTLQICYYNERLEKGILWIIVEGMPVHIHQINRMLDLMIDGDDGCWVFGNDVIYKTDYKVHHELIVNH